MFSFAVLQLAFAFTIGAGSLICEVQAGESGNPAENVEFLGYVGTGADTWLLSLADKERSDWVEVGGRFQGQLVKSLNRETDSVTLVTDGIERVVHLKKATIRESKVTVSRIAAVFERKRAVTATEVLNALGQPSKYSALAHEQPGEGQSSAPTAADAWWTYDAADGGRVSIAIQSNAAKAVLHFEPRPNSPAPRVNTLWVAAPEQKEP